MGLKLLHSADWHLDSPFAGFPEKQRQLLKEEQRKIPGKIADLCRRENCDLVLLAGDLFDGDASRETLERVKNALADCGVPVLISPGNHDFCAPGSPWLEENWPENVFVFTGALESVSIQALDCRIYGAGFQSMDCEGLLEDFRAEGDERYHLAVLHGDPALKTSPYNPVTAPQVRDSGLDYLALGHIHKAGAFRAGKTLCAWPGCPMGRGWDETGEKGVCIVTLGGESDIRPVSLDTLRFFDLDVDIGRDAAIALEEALPGFATQDFYRISLTGTGSVEPEELKKRFPLVPNLELRDKTEPPIDLWADIDEDTLEGVYFGMLRRDMDADPENAGRIRLAAEISRKILAGREVVL
ncbi:MAG: DNA repair exonuclease [Oscillospiraceae bacterium]|nr:DNA repair exonuclease [Oscillospiraceae bacterium]